MIVEILIVVVLTVLNGALAMSELAVVSSRPARLKVMAQEGDKGADVALKLAEDPGKFLSSVQIGITLVGVLSGAFSGATLGARLALWLESVGVADNIADALGVGPASQTALHDAGKDPAAEFYRFRLAARRSAGRLSALPR